MSTSQLTGHSSSQQISFNSSGQLFGVSFRCSGEGSGNDPSDAESTTLTDIPFVPVDSVAPPKSPYSFESFAEKSKSKTRWKLSPPRETKEAQSEFLIDSGERSPKRKFFSKRTILGNMSFFFSIILHCFVVIYLIYNLLIVVKPKKEIVLQMQVEGSVEPEFKEAEFEISSSSSALDSAAAQAPMEIFSDNLVDVINHNSFGNNKNKKDGKANETGSGDGEDPLAEKGDGKSANFFGITARGKKFVYVIDKSESMGSKSLFWETDSRGEPLIEHVKAEAIKSINKLTQTQSVHVCFFDNRNYPMPHSKGMVSATRQNRKDISDWISSISSGGSTNPISSIRSAFAMKPDAIYLLSDGDFPWEAKRSIEMENTGQIPIHCISLTRQDSVTQLASIARTSRGTFRKVPNGVKKFLEKVNKLDGLEREKFLDSAFKVNGKSLLQFREFYRYLRFSKEGYRYNGRKNKLNPMLHESIKHATLKVIDCPEFLFERITNLSPNEFDKAWANTSRRVKGGAWQVYMSEDAESLKKIQKSFREKIEAMNLDRKRVEDILVLVIIESLVSRRIEELEIE